MIRRILEGNIYFWVAFHAVLGILAGINHQLITIWVYVICASTALTIVNPNKKEKDVHYFFAYYVTLEIIVRMLKLSPFVPVESGKYLGMFLMLLALATRPHNTDRFRISNRGLAICLLSVPSIYLMVFDDTFWGNLVFCWFAIFDLGLFTIYFSNFTFSKEEIIKIFRLLIYPLIAVCAYLFVHAPSLAEMEFGITANAAASGNFGPNQVSSILGVGIFIMASSLLLGYTLFKNKIIDIVLLLIFTFRCMLTVSRGGMFSAIMGIAVIYFLSNKSRTVKQKAAGMVAFIGITVAIFFTFQYVNKVSGNTLNERYKGTTLDVYNGEKQGNLETLTDGRSTIALAEIGIFIKNPVFGVGPGQSTLYWDINEKWDDADTAGGIIASHTELTRLLAEHGIFGLIICFLLLQPIWYFWKKRKSLFAKGYAYYLNLGFLVFGISMSVHSAMRTLITPFFFGLAFAGMHMAKTKLEKKKHATIEEAVEVE